MKMMLLLTAISILFIARAEVELRGKDLDDKLRLVLNEDNM